jgi:ribosomal protein L25 (general stress protein Ctc)
VNPQEHLAMETTENIQIKAVSESLLDQDHQEKRHKVLIRDIQQESLKETPLKLPHGNPKKRPRKSPKRKNGRNTTKP